MRLIKALPGVCCGLLLTIASAAIPALAANPAAIAYFGSTTNAELYGHETGIIVTGRCNTSDPKFVTARKGGAEVLVYIDAVERPDQYICGADQQFYMNSYGQVPLWPYPSYGQRVNWPNHHMTDMRPGSAWILHIVAYVENLMRSGKFDGVYLDVVGARPWDQNAAWGSWPQWEKDKWTDGNIDLVRRLDASRRAINSKFIIVNNNVWDRGWPDTRGFAGEKYVDGVVIEHMPSTSGWHKAYAGRTFGSLGHRRVIVIAKGVSEAYAWSKVPGVTHVSNQSTYGFLTVPSIPFTNLYDH